MLRAGTRSILGRNCGASFCSISVQRMPRRPRSTASVSPVGPAPAMRTGVSMGWVALPHQHVMAGLVRAIHVFLCAVKQGVDGRDKPGHDVEKEWIVTKVSIPRRAVAEQD